jgi:hypothetical protein
VVVTVFPAQPQVVAALVVADALAQLLEPLGFLGKVMQVVIL